MKANSDFKDLLSSLSSNQVRYLIVGGYAFIHHVEPRYTKDIDIWVEASESNARAVYNALKEFGAPLKQLDLTESDFQKEGYFVQLGLPPSRIDILMSLKGLSFEAAWDNRVIGDFDGEEALFISKKDLLTVKKAAGRPQDLLDVEALEKTL